MEILWLLYALTSECDIRPTFSLFVKNSLNASRNTLEFSLRLQISCGFFMPKDDMAETDNPSPQALSRFPFCLSNSSDRTSLLYIGLGLFRFFHVSSLDKANSILYPNTWSNIFFPYWAMSSSLLCSNISSMFSDELAASLERTFKSLSWFLSPNNLENSSSFAHTIQWTNCHNKDKGKSLELTSLKYKLNL